MDQDQLLMITERLVRMETKIDFLSERSTRNEVRLDSLERMSGPNADHEARIRKLEKIVWVAMGFAAALGGAVGGFVSNLIGI
jgi:hypothetical protein